MKITFFLFLFFVFFFGFSPEAVRAETATTTKDNPLCWSEKACEKDYTGDGAVDGEWNNTDGQAKEQCGSGDSGFCYPVPGSYELNVALPNGDSLVASVTDLGDYVNKVYLFMLGAAAIFAIVRIMAAGVQYIIAPSGGEVSGAQKKISSSLIGLVILSAAALLLATINPQLLKLEPPRLPKIRTFVYFGDDAKCEAYKDQGYGFEEDLSDSEESTCGEKGKIIKDPNGTNLTAAIDCVWTGCQGDNYNYPNTPAFSVEKVCLSEAGGGAKCMTCEEITSTSAVSPNEGGTCSALQPVFHNTGDALKASLGEYHAECVFNHDIGFESTDALEIVNNGQCAVVAFDCSSISSCGDYDTVVAWNNLGSQNLDAFQAPGILFDFSYHKSICESNPCSIAGGCKQDRTPGVEALVTGIQALSLATILSPISALTFGGLSVFNSLTGREFNALSCESTADFNTESVPTGPVGM